MPKSMLKALQNHSRLSNQAALFTCWGLNEDRQYLETLATAANLSELTIVFRPRQHVTSERLAELIIYQKQLLLRQENLKTLAIKYRYEHGGPFIHQIHMDRQERLPSIERLSLERYHFSLDNRGLQFHLNTQSLRSLTLVACRDWHLLLQLPDMKLSQLAIRKLWWRTDPWSAVSERMILQSFLCRGHDFEELELESLGLSHAMIRTVVKNTGATVRKLRIHNFEHAAIPLSTNQPVPLFKSVPAHIILSLANYCSHLHSLELDLAETDITGVSEPSSHS